MFNEQLTGFKLRAPGPPGRTYAPKTDQFHDKAKIFEENIRVDYYLLLKYCRRQYTLLPPTWTKSPTIKI